MPTSFQAPLGAAGAPPAMATPAPAIAATPPPDLSMPNIQKWDSTLNLTTAAGYKDNVLLSHDQPEQSPLIRVGAEWTLMRLPEAGWTFQSYLSWEDTRYTSSRAVDKEQLGLALLQLKKSFAARLDARLQLQYLYLDQVLDLSDEQGLFRPLPVQLHALQQKLALQREWGRHPFWELEMGHARHDYHVPVDDFEEGGLRATLGHRYGHRSEFSLAYEYNHRWYDSRRATDASGLPLPGSRLEYAQHRLHVRWSHYFDQARRWRLGLRAGLERSFDNGADYYGYWKYWLQPHLRYQHPRWSCQASLRVSHYDYPIQTVDIPLRPRYERTELTASLRGELKLAREIRFQLEWQHERNLSNWALTEYRANTVFAGFYWKF